MNIHLVPRTIYLTRHGESLNNLAGRIGGDSDLSARGEQFVTALADLINKENIPGEESGKQISISSLYSGIRVWTSWLKRSIQTGSGIEGSHSSWKEFG